MSLSDQLEHCKIKNSQIEVKKSSVTFSKFKIKIAEVLTEGYNKL